MDQFTLRVTGKLQLGLRPHATTIGSLEEFYGTILNYFGE